MEAPNANALLDKFTRFLAYIGDELAQDGYSRNKNTNIRRDPYPQESMNGLVKKIISLLTGENTKSLNGVPEDIVNKIKPLKEMYNTATNSKKKELIQYMSGYNSEQMYGGMRKTKRRSNNRKNRKTRSRK